MHRDIRATYSTVAFDKVWPEKEYKLVTFTYFDACESWNGKELSVNLHISVIAKQSR